MYQNDIHCKTLPESMVTVGVCDLQYLQNKYNNDQWNVKNRDHWSFLIPVKIFVVAYNLNGSRDSLILVCPFH